MVFGFEISQPVYTQKSLPADNLCFLIDPQHSQSIDTPHGQRQQAGGGVYKLHSDHRREPLGDVY